MVGLGLGYSGARDVSTDGINVVGSAHPSHGFRWTESEGMVILDGNYSTILFTVGCKI